jgi:hypothetical protein
MSIIDTIASFVRDANTSVDEASVRKAIINIKKDAIFYFEKERFSTGFRNVFDETFGEYRTEQSIREYFEINYILYCVKDAITGQEVIYLKFIDDGYTQKVYETNP